MKRREKTEEREKKESRRCKDKGRKNRIIKGRNDENRGNGLEGMMLLRVMVKEEEGGRRRCCKRET